MSLPRKKPNFHDEVTVPFQLWRESLSLEVRPEQGLPPFRRRHVLLIKRTKVNLSSSKFAIKLFFAILSMSSLSLPEWYQKFNKYDTIWETPNTFKKSYP